MPLKKQQMTCDVWCIHTHMHTHIFIIVGEGKGEGEKFLSSAIHQSGKIKKESRTFFPFIKTGKRGGMGWEADP